MVPGTWLGLGHGSCQCIGSIINSRGVKESLLSPRFWCLPLAAHPQPCSPTAAEAVVLFTAPRGTTERTPDLASSVLVSCPMELC